MIPEGALVAVIGQVGSEKSFGDLEKLSRGNRETYRSSPKKGKPNSTLFPHLLCELQPASTSLVSIRIYQIELKMQVFNGHFYFVTNISIST